MLQINIIEIEDDHGIYANTWLSFAVDPTQFIGKKVLAVPRCCQKRKGTQDRWRANTGVNERDGKYLGKLIIGTYIDILPREWHMVSVVV